MPTKKLRTKKHHPFPEHVRAIALAIDDERRRQAITVMELCSRAGIASKSQYSRFRKYGIEMGDAYRQALLDALGLEIVVVPKRRR